MSTEPPLPRNAPIDATGIWAQVLRPPPGGAPRPALFLDRDGTMVEEVEYLHRVEDVRWIAGAPRVVAEANRRGVAVVIATNQAGVGRRYFGWEAFAAVQEKIVHDLAEDGAFVDAVYACPHHGEAKAPYDHPSHPARKPNPGMLLGAVGDLGLDVARSWIIGDRAGDIEAGLRAGIAGGLHVLSGHGADSGERQAASALAGDGFRVLAGTTIADALERVPLFASD
ncbi:MAG: HAD family hydrolase [Rhodospirillales bacterium]|jgi:D-glycero-D-manno-heptose 1,7-bisphosphate phosphatase|nr:HAD family hydrolase [Rhodospirillales bacterium]MDP6774456.1 HAD family hydrolase [Rhodospirillales bacterium]